MKDYKNIYKFILDRGTSLSPYSGFGLNKSDSILFLDMLKENDIGVIQIDVGYNNNNFYYSPESIILEDFTDKKLKFKKGNEFLNFFNEEKSIFVFSFSSGEIDDFIQLTYPNGN